LPLKKTEAIVSIYKAHDLYFLVAISPSTGKILKITLPQSDKTLSIMEVAQSYPNYKLSPEYEDIAREVSKLYSGDDADLVLDQLELNPDKEESPIKTLFMRNVLQETYKIPKGNVETYKSLAKKVDSHAYRAVGTVMAKNPFPLIIPCHRVVKSDYSVGNYGGGSEMKKELLIREGVKLEGNKIIKNWKKNRRTSKKK